MGNKHIVSIFAAMALTVGVSAQQEGDNNYVGVNFGGGLGTMVYDVAGGERNSGGGLETGLFFGHFFTESVGLGVGLQYSLVHSSAVYDSRETTTGLVHPSNPNVLYNQIAKYESWKEGQSMGILGIPVEILCRKPLNDSWSFVGGLGLSLDMHVGGKYKAKDGSYALAGTFPALGSYELSDMPEHGFARYDDVYGAKIENKSKVGSSLVLDAGVRRSLSEHVGLYMGLYFGYGFTNILDTEKSAPLVVVNSQNAKQVDYAGTFDSRETDKAHVLRIGAKVAVDLGWGKREKKVEEKPTPAPPAVDKEAERLAAEKAAAEKAAAEKAAAEKAAAEKAAAEKAAAEKAAAEKAAAAKVEAEKLLKDINATVYFSNAGTDISLDAPTAAAVSAICEAIKADGKLKVIITGHTDSTGTKEANEKYGTKRAEALRDYMVRHGAPAENIECESKGSSEPVADNKTEAGRAKNRRATVMFK